VMCDMCDMAPVVGVRYKCVICPNFDLCSACAFHYPEVGEHKSTHAMLRMPVPLDLTVEVRDEREAVNAVNAVNAVTADVTTQTAEISTRSANTQTVVESAQPSVVVLLNDAHAVVERLGLTESEAIDDVPDLVTDSVETAFAWRNEPRMFGIRSRASDSSSTSSVHRPVELQSPVASKQEARNNGLVAVGVIYKDSPVSPSSSTSPKVEAHPTPELAPEPVSTPVPVAEEAQTERESEEWVTEMHPAESISDSKMSSLNRLETWEQLQIQLASMGFTDEQRNVSLLIQHDGDLNEVVMDLLRQT